MARVKRVSLAPLVIPAFAAIFLFNLIPVATVSTANALDRNQGTALAPPSIFQIVREVTYDHNEKSTPKMHLAAESSTRAAQWPLGRLGIPDEVDLSGIDIAIVGTGANVLDDIQSGAVVGGWNFYDQNSDYRDVHGHDTHMLEILANREFGGARTARIHIYRVSNPAGNSTFEAFVRCIPQAQTDHIKIMLCAWGGRGNPPDDFVEAIRQARDAGILVVTGVGNDAANIDITPDTWKVADANVFRTAATVWSGNDAPENADTLAGYSASGHGWADVAFPGEALTAHTETSATWDTGTSVATAWATVSAAVIWAQNLTQDWRSVKGRMMASVVPCSALADKVFAEGRASVSNALANITRQPLDKVTIKNLKLKNQKKVQFVLEAEMNDMGTPQTLAVYRVYARDLLLGIMEDPGKFSAKIAKVKPGSAVSLTSESSHGGRDDRLIQN